MFNHEKLAWNQPADVHGTAVGIADFQPALTSSGIQASQTGHVGISWVTEAIDLVGDKTIKVVNLDTILARFYVKTQQLSCARPATVKTCRTKIFFSLQKRHVVRRLVVAHMIFVLWKML